MSIKYRLKQIITQPRHIVHEILLLLLYKTRNLWTDSVYLKAMFRLTIGKKLSLKSPQSYNEKVQWLKLYDRKPEYTTMVDKYAVKGYVAGIIGEEYVIPTLGVWDKPEDIVWDSLPERFVLKTTHGGGSTGVVICKDKESICKEEVIDKLNKSMKIDIYENMREWPYKNVPKRIIAEKYIEEPGLPSPRDYKLLCFNGKVKLIEYHEGRFTENYTQDFYDNNWNLTKITQGSYGDYHTEPSPRPELLDKMIYLSEKLADNIPHVRVDWYIIDGHLLFGEITFYDGSGFCPFDRYEDDLLIGSWITLPEKDNHKRHMRKE